MKISINETEVHDKKEFIAKFYVQKSERKEFSALLVECLKRHYKTKLKNATRLYFVIEGKGEFTIDGKTLNANPYDLFIINHGQEYEYEGKMKLFEVNMPATDTNNEEKLE